MADTEHGDDVAFTALLRVADKLDAGKLELYFDHDGHIRLRRRVALSSPFLGAVLQALLMYIICIVVATYLLVQAMEAISFILSPNTGIVLKVVWLIFISVCGLFTIVSIEMDMEDNGGRPVLPRWMLDNL